MIGIHIKRVGALMAAMLLALSIFMPLPAQAQKPERKVVRVGWYESPYNFSDRFGRRSGYAYEYQQKIAAYTGWEYEYVEGSWPELLEMLKTGEIDLMSDVSYTDERAGEMLFSSQPMGAEAYYIFVAVNNTEIGPTASPPSGGSGSASTRTAFRRICSATGRGGTVSTPRSSSCWSRRRSRSRCSKAATSTRSSPSTPTATAATSPRSRSASPSSSSPSTAAAPTCWRS